MGSLASRPSVPAQPQVVFVPQPAVTNTASPAEPADNPPVETSSDETATEIRKQSLLGRERSRFGTVLTGFRGLLGLSENTQPRKTLLGE